MYIEIISLSLSIYIYTHVCIYIYIYTCVYIYIYIYMYIHIYIHMCIGARRPAPDHRLHQEPADLRGVLCTRIVCMYIICIYVCMYIYIYIYIYTHTHTCICIPFSPASVHADLRGVHHLLAPHREAHLPRLGVRLQAYVYIYSVHAHFIRRTDV